MRRFFKIVLPILFFFLIVSPVSAQCCNPATPSSFSLPQEKFEQLEQIRERLKERGETIRLEIQERRATITARLAEKRKERIRNFFRRLTRRLQAAINRLERLIARIKSRLDKIETANEDIDTSKAREDLNEAEVKLASASAALTEAKTSLEDILAAENPKEAFADLRDLIQGIKRQLIEIHLILVQTIGDIKGLRVGQGG